MYVQFRWDCLSLLFCGVFFATEYITQFRGYVENKNGQHEPLRQVDIMNG